MEVLGRSFLYGIGYDRMLSDEVSIGASFSYLMASLNPVIAESKVQVLSLPIYTNYYFTTGKHRFLATGGINIFAFSAQANITESVQAEVNKAQTNTTEENTEGGSSSPFSIPQLEISGSGVMPIPQMGVGYEFRSRNGFLAGTNLYVMYALGKVIPWAGLNIGVTF